MESHGEKKHEFDAENGIVSNAEVETRDHSAQKKAHDAGDQQDTDSYPGESLETSASLIERSDPSLWRQRMDCRSKDNEKKDKATNPEGDG